MDRCNTFSMNINKMPKATYTNVFGDEFAVEFVNYCDVNGETDEQGGYAQILMTLTGEVVPQLRIVERNQITLEK